MLLKNHSKKGFEIIPKNPEMKKLNDWMNQILRVKRVENTGDFLRYSSLLIAENIKKINEYYKKT